jgi:hypothetical protein
MTADLSDAHVWELERAMQRAEDYGDFPLAQALQAALALSNVAPKESSHMDRLTNEIDVQGTLDTWLEGNPEAQKYIRKIYYVPEGAEIPPDVTHMNRLTSAHHLDLELRLGVVATAETTAIANVILGLIGRAAPDPKAE